MILFVVPLSARTQKVRPSNFLGVLLLSIVFFGHCSLYWFIMSVLTYVVHLNFIFPVPGTWPRWISQIERWQNYRTETTSWNTTNLPENRIKEVLRLLWNSIKLVILRIQNWRIRSFDKCDVLHPKIAVALSKMSLEANLWFGVLVLDGPLPGSFGKSVRWCLMGYKPSPESE